MNRVLICLFSISITQFVLGQVPPSEYSIFILKADSLFKLKEYRNAANNYSLAFKTKGWKGLMKDRYNAARSWTLSNMTDSAFDCLERIVNKIGYADFREITNEKDFTPLHSDQRWQPLVDQVKRNKLPSGWFRSGDDVTSYKMFIDSLAGQEGKNVLTIFSTEQRTNGWGGLMQIIMADHYLGKRIRMTAYIKSKEVKNWAGLVLRVEQYDSEKYLQFDNMDDRPVIGTSKWKKHELVLDVPLNASKIAFGAWMEGAGQIWFEKITLEEVDPSVPLTGRIKDSPNFDFTK